MLQPSADGDDEERPAWQWAGIGGCALLIGFFPLSMLANAYAKRVLASLVVASGAAETKAAITAMTASQRLWLSVVVVIGPLVALALAGLVSGLTVGRFGGDAGKKEAAVGGLGAAVLISLVSASEVMQKGSGPLGWLLVSSVVIVLAGASAYLGAHLGLKLR